MGSVKPLVVLGSGPVGLMSALRGCQLGMNVAVYANCFPAPQDPPRVECVPAQVVALLVEFGVSPKRIGSMRCFENERCNGPPARLSVRRHPTPPTLSAQLSRLRCSN